MLDLIVLLEQMKNKFGFNFEIAIKSENYGYLIRISTFDEKYGVAHYEQFSITEEQRQNARFDLLEHKFELAILKLGRRAKKYNG